MTHQVDGGPTTPSRTRLRSPAFFAVLAAGTGLLGVVVALLIGAPLGEDHGCPAGASVDACHYPPDVGSWLVSWGAGGVLLGLAVATFVAATLGADGPHRRPQKHLLPRSTTDRS